MVRFDQAALDDADGSIQAYLSKYGTVDNYLTSASDYLPLVRPEAANQAPSDATRTVQRAHDAVLQQLHARTPKLANGTELYREVDATRLLPIGCSSIDDMLGGGLRETTVTEVAGETCSGKTQLCHLAAVTTAQRDEPVMYFDTTNAFSAGRAQQLVESVDPQEVQTVLQNITVVRCHSIHALLASLDELAQQASSKAASTWPKLVIVDSVSALLSPLIGASQHNQGHVLVAETARLLRHTAQALQCSLLVTNHVVGAGGGFAAGRQDQGLGGGAASSSLHTAAPGGMNLGYKPALGEQWKGAAHVRLQLSRADGDRVAATLLTHLLKPPGLRAWFAIGADITAHG